MSNLKLELPTHIKNLEYQYQEAVEEANRLKLGSTSFYQAIKRAQDIQRQIQTNKMVASIYGVSYGVQVRAVGSSS